MTNEKIVCVTKNEYYIGTLTYGKIYDATWDETEPVYSSTGLYYTIINDVGIKHQYHDSHFISLDKWRQTQLNKIID